MWGCTPNEINVGDIAQKARPTFANRRCAFECTKQPSYGKMVPLKGWIIQSSTWSSASAKPGNMADMWSKTALMCATWTQIACAFTLQCLSPALLIYQPQNQHTITSLTRFSRIRLPCMACDIGYYYFSKKIYNFKMKHLYSIVTYLWEHYYVVNYT